MNLMAIPVLAADAPGHRLFSCVVPLESSRELPRYVSPYATGVLPGLGLLLWSENGLFLVRGDNGAIVIEPLGKADTGQVLGLDQLRGTGVLVRAEKGLFLVRVADGAVTVEPAGKADIDIVSLSHPLAGGEVLIAARKGWFQMRRADHAVTVEAVGQPGWVWAYKAHDLPGGGVLITTERGWFFVNTANGAVTIERAANAPTAEVYGTVDLAGVGVLIDSTKGWFLARSQKNAVTFEPLGKTHPGRILKNYRLSAAGVLIVAEKGWFYARSENGAVVLEPAVKVDTGEVVDGYELPGAGVLVVAKKGWFLARAGNGAFTIEPFGRADMGEVFRTYHLPESGALIWAEKGWFYARAANGAVSVQPAGNADTGVVFQTSNLPGVGALIQAEKGWFLAHQTKDSVNVELVGRGNVGTVGAVYDVPAAGALVRSTLGWFLATRSPLSDATVRLMDKETLDGRALDSARAFSVSLMVRHICAPAVDQLNLHLELAGPAGKTGPPLKVALVRTDSTSEDRVEVRVPVTFGVAGRFSLQLVSLAGGTEQKVGRPETLDIKSPADPAVWLTRVGVALPVLLALANAVLFLMARRSGWAWEMATDDGLSTWMLRVGTLTLRNLSRAQLWILDLYFQRRRGQLSTVSPFLPMPLTGLVAAGDRRVTGVPAGQTDGDAGSSEQILAPPWIRRRLWIMGNSGMGKTALFRHVTEAHYRDHETAFSAYDRWRCVLVPFAARDFVDGKDDERTTEWVLNAVRATLSSQGLTFSDDKLLDRFLRKGTVGVAIDGLNEANRNLSVAAFAEAYSEVPLLVTSQEPGGKGFEAWRLPTDIRDFTEALIRLHLGADGAAVVLARMAKVGLQDAVRSGYDVRLIIDLTRNAPREAPLPADRLGLYGHVLTAGWPDVSVEQREEQQSQAAAAAWRMVSERKPNDDMRRLKPGVDLPQNLLVALADAPEQTGRSLRLVRRAGNDFEFVHDQMHLYLAARWFAQNGFGVGELVKMLEVSTIWTHAPDTRRILWDFAAALLDDDRLAALLKPVDDMEGWDSLRFALRRELERRHTKEA